jgi:tRNA threonylcarbamoyladenosine biosynthesis protein TsaE
MRAEMLGGKVVVEVGSEAETEAAGRALAAGLGPGDVVGLVGELGAGKTRIARAIAGALGAQEEEVSSPTFVLVHEYEGRGGLPIYHFDTYRLDGPGAFEAIGAGEYLEGEGVSLVEWADRFPELLPARTIWVRLDSTGSEGRRLEIVGLGESASQELLRWLASVRPPV